MRTNRSCYAELAIAREQLIFGRDSRAGKGVEKLYLGKPQVCSDWRLLAWENWRWANKKQGILGDWFGEFLWLLLSWKRGGKKRKLQVIEQILTILGRLLQRLWLGFPWCLLQRIWLKSYCRTWSDCYLFVYSVCQWNLEEEREIAKRKTAKKNGHNWHEEIKNVFITDNKINIFRVFLI